MFNLFCYFILGMIWGSSFPLMKIITPYIGASWVIEFRSIFGAIFLSLTLIPKFPKIQIGKNLHKLVIISTCKFVLPFLLVAKATESIPASIIAVLFSTGPLLSAALTTILEKKRTTKTKLLGLLLGFSGVAFLLLGADNNPTHGNNDIYPMVLVVFAAFIYAVGGIYTHNVSHSIKMTPTGILVSGLWIASIIGLIFPLLTNKNVPELKSLMPVLPHLISLGCLSTGFANLLYFRLLKAWGAVSAISVIFTVPVFGMFWCSVLLSEVITLNMLICSVLVIIGSLLVISKQ